MKLEVGDVLVCRGKSTLSKLIMKVTNGIWSHSALYTEVWGKPSIIEAQQNGVNFKLFDVWLNKYGYEYEVFRYNKEFDKKELTNRAFSKCGETKYDFFTFFVKIPFRLLIGKEKYKKDKPRDKKQICSEFTSWVWKLPTKEITPQEQHEYFTNSTDWDKITE